MRPPMNCTQPGSVLRHLVCATSLFAAALALASCGSEGTAKHEVYFVGYVHDGATGKRLTAADLTGISVKYGKRVINTKVEEDGRFLTTEALPTWQDYSVYVGAEGYRPFVSSNPGIDVPKAVQMTDGVSTHGTVQTFEVVVRLFPLDLQASKVTLTIEKSDALVRTPPPERAAGTLRLTPVSASLVEQSSPTGTRVWFNNQDLLTQTVTKAFTGGVAEIAAGELVYGVTYQIAIFDIDGYQPFNALTSQSGLLSAGAVTSLFLTVQPHANAPLRVLGTTADACVPPVPSANAYGASITITFSEAIEAAGPTFAEDIDNGVSITTAATTSVCPLNTSTDATKQERGTKASIEGRVLTLSFNPVVGLATITSFGTTCVAPAAFNAVVYAMANVFVQPKGDPVRKASVGTLLSQAGLSTTVSSGVSCPGRPPTTTF